MDVILHNFIERHNVLQKPTEQIGAFLRNRPHFHKIALIIAHLVRTIPMMAFCYTIPFSLPVNIGICFAFSLYYRLVVEIKCNYKFALPAFVGSLAIPVGIQALAKLISGVAFISMQAFAQAFVSLLPLVAYITYVVLTVNYDVKAKR